MSTGEIERKYSAVITGWLSKAWKIPMMITLVSGDYSYDEPGGSS